jgi:hypothetical protein
LGSQCTNYLQQHKLVMTCVAWGADRKDAVLHRLFQYILSTVQSVRPLLTPGDIGGKRAEMIRNAHTFRAWPHSPAPIRSVRPSHAMTMVRKFVMRRQYARLARDVRITIIKM